VGENSFAQWFAERRRLLYLTVVKLKTGRITTIWLYITSAIVRNEDKSFRSLRFVNSLCCATGE